MPYHFVLPDLGEGTTEGEVRKWTVKEGDPVEEHQTVLEIETDKAVVEVPSPRKGRILKILHEEGSIVKVGEVLLTIAEEGEAAQGKAPLEERPKSVSVVGQLPEEEEVLATPAVRALARELGVSLDGVKGSGPGGSITKEDVQRGTEKTKKSEVVYGETERIPLRGLRKTIAKNLLASQRATAFVTGMDEADITELWQLREREKKATEAKGVHLTFMPFLMKAVIHALAHHPMLNASIDDEREEIIVRKYYTIGVAIDTAEGLMVAAIKDAARKTIIEIAAEIQDLAAKAKTRKITLEEMRGSTFTITNYGHFGGIFATPIINHPEVAILGAGRISEKPWVKDGQIVIRRVLPLSLTFDHRVTDGVDASKFLSRIIAYLEDPALLFIESS